MPPRQVRGLTSFDPSHVPPPAANLDAPKKLGASARLLAVLLTLFVSLLLGGFVALVAAEIGRLRL
jgi:hypothetical protein